MSDHMNGGHWGLVFGHWGFGMWWWLIAILIAVALVKYLFNSK